MGRRLVIDGNAVYEVDEECMREKSQKCENLQGNDDEFSSKYEDLQENYGEQNESRKRTKVQETRGASDR